MARMGLGLAASIALATCLGGCGGGSGGEHVASTPPPPPPLSGAVDIFPNPTTQEFATIGTGGDIRIRYDASTSSYEVMAGDLGWRRLIDDPQSQPLPGRPNQNFRISGDSQSFFMIRVHHSFDVPDAKYLYSNIADWTGGGQGGIVAFGSATPDGSVPVTGSATYSGMLDGFGTDTYLYEGSLAAGNVEGTIGLTFDYGAGSLSGSISPTLQLDTNYSLGTISFKDTVYSTGSGGFSGKFDTNVAGNNGFSGLFTGPNAQELIGKFALPYTSPVNGTAQQAQGAFIAKK